MQSVQGTLQLFCSQCLVHVLTDHEHFKLVSVEAILVLVLLHAVLLMETPMFSAIIIINGFTIHLCFEFAIY